MTKLSITLRLAAVLLLLGPQAELRAGEQGPIVGAIRWDGWYGDATVAKAVEASLGQPKYHFRLPWFAKVHKDGSVRINGDSQATIEQELTYSAAAKLNYWAFVDYWDLAPGMSSALNRYLAAKNKRGIRYCLVEEGHRLDRIGSAGWKWLVEHFQQPDYQAVLDGRPLLFVFEQPKKIGKLEWDDLRRQTLAAGLKSPNLVLMGYRPEQDAKDMVAIGFDAVSAYARGGSYSMTQPTYAEQCVLIRRERWEKWQALRVPSITFASAGWDTRPRNERAPPWLKDEIKAEPDPMPAAKQKPLIDGVTATPDELAAPVCEAVQWAGSHRDLNPANAVIIYAWNEHDEGGWLQPTRGADGKTDASRIHALGKALGALQPPVPNSKP